MMLIALEFYSGIGGLHCALQRCSRDAKVVRAFDWDQNACKTYAANHDDIVENIDIGTLTASKLAVYDASIWLMSPSCQPYTVLNPDAKGAEDKRAQSFIHLVTAVLPELSALQKAPEYLLVENVAGFERSSTRTLLTRSLQDLEYTICELLLTPLQFGIPNSRLRYYLLARRQPFASVCGNDQDVVWRHIPGTDGQDWSDPRHTHSTEEVTAQPADVAHYLLPEPEEVSTHHSGQLPYISDRVLMKWGRLFDIVLPSSRRTCCFTRGYTRMAERSGSVLQLNENLDTTTVFDEFLAAKAAEDPNAVRILDPLRLRYFTPEELLRLFCFVDEGHPRFEWPESITMKTKYRLLGNSVNVAVVTVLLNYLLSSETAEN